ncbi:hypothetical protein H5410_001144, partial [Solanum commersonii]
MAKKMAGLSIKNDEEALYTNKSRNIKQAAGGFKKKHFHGDECSRGVSKNQKNDRRFEGNCYNCGKKGHMEKDCWFKKQSVEINTTTSNSNEKSEDVWDAEAFFAIEEKDLELSSTILNQLIMKMTGSLIWVVQIIWLVINKSCRIHQCTRNDYHVPGMRKNLLSVSQLTISRNYILFCPDEVRIYQDLKNLENPIMKGRRLEFVYVMSIVSAYKPMVKGLPQLEVRADITCLGCQFGKAYQL